jgi:NhaP-type Na+/H+ or K+/H+ antiporter
MESIDLIIVLLGVVLIATVSKRIDNTIITLPMLYTLFGLFVGLVFFDFVESTLTSAVVEFIATLALVVILASDASRIKLRRYSAFQSLPLRLLAIGLPLTIVLGAIVAAVIFGELSIWVAFILAVILAPTDASLGESVVDNLKVPVRIRQAINIESGLNDGIALPFLMLFIALAEQTQTGEGEFLLFLGGQIGLGLLIGAVMGYLSGRYLTWGLESGWMSPLYRALGAVALLLLTYGVTELVGGNGFIASFVFGIVAGNLFNPPEGESIYSFAKVEYTGLLLMTYIFFGMVMLVPALKNINLTVVVYALLSLTVVRMLPVALSLIGTKLKPITVLFTGWFGPRGIASILYFLTVLNRHDIAGVDVIYDVVMITVFISVIAHGVSAAPLANWYGKRITELEKDGSADAETLVAPEMFTRKGNV